MAFTLTLTLTGDHAADMELIRSAAYNTLIKYKYKRLPINLDLLLDDVYFTPYEEMSRYHDVTVDYLLQKFGKYGAVRYDTRRNKFCAIYNKQDKNSNIYTFALGLAYIHLQFYIPDHYIPFEDTNPAIFEYANCLLAPDVILEMCGLTENPFLMDATHLPFRNATIKEQRLSKYRRAPYCLCSETEKVLLHNFASYQKFIDGMRNKTLSNMELSQLHEQLYHTDE